MRFPAEWEKQSGIQLTWPDSRTDWGPALEEIVPVYEQIAREILTCEKLLIVCRDKKELPPFLQVQNENLIVKEMDINDTWARDHGALTVMENEQPVLLNFRFNGWGMKFAACFDNQITPNLYNSKTFQEKVGWRDYSFFTFEGGAIESNGAGCLLTTSECLLSKNRNGHMSRKDIDEWLKKIFYALKMIWLEHGFLEGDDTDSHIDTLARFCSRNTIAYVKCENPFDAHYGELKKMEEELFRATDQDGRPFNLVALPFPDPVFDAGKQRLPATYANFLVLNKAVLLPVYGVRQDREAVEILNLLFPERKIITINSIPLVKQHGSVHCISMQFPEGVL